LRIGIIGCGFIGTTIGGSVEQMEKVEAINLLDVDFQRAVQLSSRLSKGKVFRMSEMDDFVKASDMVIESASQAAVKEFMPRVLEAGKDGMILSIGALVDDELWDNLKSTAERTGSRILIPSGAVAGIDGIYSGSMADIDCVTLIVRKPPGGLSLPPELHDRSNELRDLKEPVVLFDGKAREAVRMFPKNVNVAATVALAGIGFDRTSVKIIADPRVQRNMQSIEVRGRFGEMKIEMMNQPSTSNPRTSYMAPLSAIAMIKKVLSGVYIGN
jgi:aspartate dehydrogenase